MRHQLSLEVPLVANCSILTVQDTSVYTPALSVECGKLEITVPGFVTKVSLEVDPQFIRHLDACQLEIQPLGCDDEQYVLPDGIYVIRYSVKPTAKVWVEYHHLRMTATQDHYYRLLGTLALGVCEPEPEQKKILQQFQLIRSFLEAAKAKVEYCHEPQKGMELFNYARRLLEKLPSCTPCSPHLIKSIFL